MYNPVNRKRFGFLLIFVFLATVLCAPPKVSALSTAPITSAPACITRAGTNNIDCFVRGLDGAIWESIYHYCFIFFCWGAWSSLGGAFLSAPAVATFGAGNLIVTGQGLDTNMYWNVYNGASWSGWSDAGTNFLSYPGSAPACVTYRPDRPAIECVVRSVNNNLYTDYDNSPATLPLSGGQWSNFGNGPPNHPPNLVGGVWSGVFSPLGDTSDSANPCTASATCQEDYFFFGRNPVAPPALAIWQEHWDDATGFAAAPVLLPSPPDGPFANSGPGCGSWGPGRIDCFVTTANGNLWHDWYSGSWFSENLGVGPGLTSGPTVASTGVGVLEVFARGYDNGLWEKIYNGAWGSWFPVDPLPGLGGAVDLAINNPTQAGLGFEQTANAFDNSAAGYAIAHRLGAKAVFTFMDSTRVNQATGELNFSPDYSNAVVFAGPAANPTTNYYETSGLAVLHAQLSGGSINFYNGASLVYSGSLASLSSTNDYFVAESFLDGSHTVIILYGINAPGTLASGVWFDSILWPALSVTTSTAYIVHWSGTTPNVPLPTDTYTVVYHN